MHLLSIIVILIFFTSCASAKQPLTVRSVTYNTHYMESGLSGIIETLKETKGDVIALQEVLIQGEFPTSAIIAKNLGYQHVASNPYVKGKESSWCLSIISRFPIRNTKEIKLGKSRMALMAEIQIQNRKIFFITLHLTPISGATPDKNQIKQRILSRKQEIKELLIFSKLLKEPIVLLGDFNMLRGTFGMWGSNEYSMILDERYKDADGGFFPTNHDTFPLPISTKEKIAEKIPMFLIPDAITLDYTFLSSGLQRVDSSVIKSKASDHWPLIVEMEISD